MKSINLQAKKLNEANHEENYTREHYKQIASHQRQRESPKGSQKGKKKDTLTAEEQNKDDSRLPALQGRQQWGNIFKVLLTTCQPRILYSEKRLSKIKVKQTFQTNRNWGTFVVSRITLKKL